MEHLKTIKNVLVFLAVVLIFYLLKEMAFILIPFVLALLFAIIMLPLVKFLEKIRLPKWLILPLIIILSLSVLLLITYIIGNTFSEIYTQRDFLLSKLLSKIDTLIKWINATFRLQFDSTLWVSNIYKSIESGTLNSFLTSAAQEIGSLFSSFLFFSLYYIMLLFGLSNYKSFLSYVKGDADTSFVKEFENIQGSINHYIIIKTLLSLLVGAITFIMCLIFGVKFAVFWGFIGFIFNFIPNIGSIASVILPGLMAFIQLDSLQGVLIFVVILAVAHFVIGNFVEPIIMGNKLELNTVFVILGLVFWGYIWGIPGMILSVPLLVIIKIILDKYTDYAMVARLMGFPEKKKT